MKKWIVVVLAITALVAGCDAVTIEQVQGLAGQVQTLSQTLDQYQQSTDTLVSQLHDAGKVSDDTFQKIEKISGEIDKIQEQTAAVTAAIQTVKPTGDQVQDAISVARAANQATAPFNPYSPIIETVLGIVAGLAAIFWKKSATAAAEAQAKYTAHKQGVEAAVKELQAAPSAVTGNVVASVIYNKIGEKRSDLGVS